MKIKEIKTYYRRSLPHIQPVGACFFVTFRLKNSIPRAKLYELKQAYDEKIAPLKGRSIAKEDMYKEQKRHFAKYDQLLDKIKTGPHYLKDTGIASIVAKELHRFDGELYNLLAYCIMSNHVHILIDTRLQLTEDLDVFSFDEIEFQPLQNIMKQIKGASSRFANLALDKKEGFWQKESYDHYVRNEKELNNIIAYILDNPVKARIVENWKEYAFSYLKTSP